MLGDRLENIRRRRPRVHCMANHVTANDCANLLLAVGGCPIMADEPMESEEITSCCAALAISLGTPSERRFEAMRRSLAQAKRMEIPVILDPVGVTASSFRRAFAQELLGMGGVTVIRGNAPEIRTLGGEAVAACGVDAAGEERLADVKRMACRLAKETGAIVIVTGKTDVVTDGERICIVHNGDPVMKAITGAGCQLTALLGAFFAANAEQPFEAAIAAVCMMGLCAQQAKARMTPQEGNASCRNFVIDAAYRMTRKELEEGAEYEL